jgi:predicted dehydrogenase
MLSFVLTARYFPAFKFAREHIESGSIGDILSVRGDFAFQVYHHNFLSITYVYIY